MLKYEAIAQDIQSHIEDGALAPNDKLPTVVDLCERYGVSKITVKRAFEILTERGLKRDQLYHSVYSFVQDTLGLKISSFHRIIRAVGATEEEAGCLRLDAGAPCSRSPRSASSTTERPSSSPSHAATACAPSCAT